MASNSGALVDTFRQLRLCYQTRRHPSATGRERHDTTLRRVHFDTSPSAMPHVATYSKLHHLPYVGTRLAPSGTRQGKEYSSSFPQYSFQQVDMALARTCIAKLSEIYTYCMTIIVLSSILATARVCQSEQKDTYGALTKTPTFRTKD